MSRPTGDTVTTSDVVTFCLTVPDVEWVIQAVQGLLADALEQTDWEQVGTATVEEAAEIFEDIFLSFAECP